ncbi:class I adenylate-forming enzyme family protein [Streptomyces zingiberis]|uniref:AMP-binding protein n=1 Tax=Streptomyces zingiberis TaxID=2053010 RepID=A0ABX1BYY6_9ACTN|nr:AMP-binding protein [Streptomyces zingiberis]NJQ01090.1 AMP-binding protein [Streptomyces zingiberis]
MTVSPSTEGLRPAPPAFSDLAGLLEFAARAHAARSAVRTTDGNSLTWSELGLAGRRLSGALAAAGVGRGDRVIVSLAPGPGFATALLAVLRLGAVLVPARHSATAYELEWLVRDADPAVAVADGPAAGLIEQTGVAVLRPADRYGEETSTPAAAPIEGTDPALLLYTSGSTGRPKGIVCPHAAVLFAVRAIADRVDYHSDDIVWNRLPFSFDYGLYQLFLCALAGAELVVPTAELSARELVQIRAARATVVPVVPALAHTLLRLALRDPEPTHVRLFTNTGAALRPARTAQLRTAFPGAGIVLMYGMSECKRITVAAPDEDLISPGSVGRALPGTRLFIVDSAARPLPPGETGEIVSAGPHVMDGYWHAPVETALRFRPSPDGQGKAVFTGDRGRLDHSGRLYFLGRDDDMFKHRGWRMSSTELEAVLSDIPGVEAAAALPPEPEGRLTVWAVTALTPGQVLDGVRERLGHERTPDRCIVLGRLPLTAHGKVDTSELRRTAATQS